VHGDQPWDIEASYRTFKKNGRSNGSRQGRFYLTEVNVIDNSEIPNHAEEDFLKVVKRLYELQKKVEPQAAKHKDEIDFWFASMSAKGYVEGPQFASYEELSVWDLSNIRPHVRSQIGQGYQVFFTDGKPLEEPKKSTATSSRQSIVEMDDEIPF